MWFEITSVYNEVLSAVLVKECLPEMFSLLTEPVYPYMARGHSVTCVCPGVENMWVEKKQQNFD